ncbi:hypothetical protein V1525DRAFT_420104 [Lipomyces kononenkoae]|uniref:Uncharacterized protein n=1 Tax=Lipomyces kononenkoae TaxID=34357 RepID=A0ACC3SYQ5_LIPKO
MARPSKKSLQRSIIARKNVLKRYDAVSQAAQRTETSRDQDVEELEVVEVCLTQSEINNALKRLSFYTEADKSLKYTTRPGGSQRSIRRFKAKFRNMDSSIKPLTAFNFTMSEVSTCSLDENLKRKNQDHERSRASEDGFLNHRNINQNGQ